MNILLNFIAVCFCVAMLFLSISLLVEFPKIVARKSNRLIEKQSRNAPLLVAEPPSDSFIEHFEAKGESSDFQTQKVIKNSLKEIAEELRVVRREVRFLKDAVNTSREVYFSGSRFNAIDWSPYLEKVTNESNLRFVLSRGQKVVQFTQREEKKRFFDANQIISDTADGFPTQALAE